MEQENAVKQANQPCEDEVSRLMADLDERIWNDPAEDLREWEEALRESEEYYRSIKMYDFGSGQKSNEQAMADYYGWKMVHRIQEEIRESHDLPNHVRKTGHISEKLTG